MPIGGVNEPSAAGHRCPLLEQVCQSADELAIELDNERDLRIALRVLRTDEAAIPLAWGMRGSLAVGCNLFRRNIRL
jgi:hypothetical protein